MMMDIFSSFDPNMNNLSIISSMIMWLSPMSVLFLTSLSFWVKPNWTFWLSAPLYKIMSEQVSRTTGIHMKGLNSILSPLFTLIIFSNLMGLVPYVFSTTSHLLFSLSFALPLWLMLIISAMQKAPKSTMAHLLPSNAPDWLSPALILIETISMLVRPITLSFRLAANMSAGHIVLTLIGIYLSSTLFSSLILSVLLMLIQMAYMLFEMGICLIQAYIFCLLLSLYSDDHPHL